MMLLNALSLNMLPAPDGPLTLSVTRIGVAEAREQLAARGLESAVGHADTAAVFAGELGLPVPVARLTVTLAPGRPVLVGQYVGPRLPEGATVLPAGARIDWMLVSVSRHDGQYHCETCANSLGEHCQGERS